MTYTNGIDTHREPTHRTTHVKKRRGNNTKIDHQQQRRKPDTQGEIIPHPQRARQGGCAQETEVKTNNQAAGGHKEQPNTFQANQQENKQTEG